MKICYLSHGYPPRSRGGVENHTRALAERLAGLGHEVCVFYPLLDGVNGPVSHAETVNGVSLLGFRGGTRNFFGHVAEPATEAAFADYLERGRFDVVHVQHTYHGLPLSLVPLAAAHAPLVCMTLHDFWLMCPRAHLFIEERGELCTGPRSFESCARCVARMLGMDTGDQGLSDVSRFMAVRRQAANNALEAAQVVAAPSRYVLGVHSRTLGLNGKGMVAPLGLERRFDALRKSTSDGVRFTFMGQINRLKNLRTVLEAMRMTRGQAELNVWGRRQDFREAERLDRAVQADARIRYHGPYDEKRLPEILAATDVGLVPSLTESYSLVAREFLSAGAPVLAARTGGLPESITHGVNGLLFNPIDASELAVLMQGLIDDPKQAAHLTKGIEPVVDADADAARWERIYRQGGAHDAPDAAI